MRCTARAWRTATWRCSTAPITRRGPWKSCLLYTSLVDIEDVFGVYIAPTEVERDEMNTVNLIIHQVEIRL